MFSFPRVILFLVVIFTIVVVTIFVVILVFVVVRFLITITTWVTDLGPVYAYTDSFIEPAVMFDWHLKIFCINIVSGQVE